MAGVYNCAVVIRKLGATGEELQEAPQYLSRWQGEKAVISNSIVSSTLYPHGEALTHCGRFNKLYAGFYKASIARIADIPADARRDIVKPLPPPQ